MMNKLHIVVAFLAAMAYLPSPSESLAQEGHAPEDALKKLHVADGLEISLFAAEPLVRQPVTMSVDRKNRVWVIQYLQYPEPAGLKKISGDRYDRIKYDRLPKTPPHGPKGADRVTILEDTDGDGRADSAKDFIDGLNLASGLALGHGGVWVLQSPYLLFYPDTNQDDRPDSDPIVKLVGFGLDDAHSVANSLQWGPDGWLYGAHGSTVNANVRGTKFQQGIWRYHPKTDRFELFSEGGGNTYGLDFDRVGNAIAGTNWGIPGLHQMQGAYHVKIFGKHGALHNPYTFGHFQHMRHHGQAIGKLSVGGVFYHADKWPTRFQQKFITANPLNHAIYAINLKPFGTTFETHFQERVVWSDDAWFQPVDLALEADGSLLVADWYDGNINYQITYRNRSNFDPKRGRIYRIRPKPLPMMPAQKKETQLRSLFDPNILIVRRALLDIAERPNNFTQSELSGILNRATNERDALHALWAANLIRGLSKSKDVALQSLSHRFAVVRAWGVRLLGDAKSVHPSIAKRLIQLSKTENDARVRAQLACTAKRLPTSICLSIAKSLAQHEQDANDGYLPLLLWWAFESKAITGQDLIISWLKDPMVWKSPLVHDTIAPRLAQRFTAEGEKGLRIAAQLLSSAPSSSDAKKLIQAMETQLKGLKGNRAPEALATALEEMWTDKPPHELVLFSMRLGIKKGIAEAIRRAASKSVSVEKRSELIRAIGQARPTSAINVLAQLMDEPAYRIRSAALSALSRFTKPVIARIILDRYAALDDRLKGEARQTLYRRPAWTLALLERIESKSLDATEVKLHELPHLLNHDDKKIQKLVRATWGSPRLTTPKEKRKRMLALAKIINAKRGDVKTGRAEFKNLCGKCHQLHGVGVKLGPDLTPYPRHELGYMLLHVVDPNAVIRPAYQSSIIETADGLVITGIITQSTPKTITVTDEKNKSTVLDRTDIERMKDSPQSLMPESQLAKFDPKRIRDLFAFLQSKPSAPLKNDLRFLAILEESFDSPTQVWAIHDNGKETATRFESKGGSGGGGWARLIDSSGGRMAVVIPKPWLEQLNECNRRTLSFDAKTVDPKNGQPHLAFGLVEITGSGKTVTADAAGPGPKVPGSMWTTFHLPLSAERFGVTEEVWKRILARPQRVIIRLEGFGGANEIMGLDNLTVR